MRGGNGGDLHVPEAYGAVHRLKHGFGLRQAEVQFPAGPGRGQNGTVRLFQQHVQPGDMVRVGVGDENGPQFRRGQAQLLQSRGDPAAGDSGVDQQVGVAAGEHSGVAGGAAGKGMYGGQEKYLAF